MYVHNNTPPPPPPPPPKQYTYIYSYISNLCAHFASPETVQITEAVGRCLQAKLYGYCFPTINAFPFFFGGVWSHANHVSFDNLRKSKVQMKRVQINGWSKSNLIKIKPVLYDQLWMWLSTNCRRISKINILGTVWWHILSLLWTFLIYSN